MRRIIRSLLVAVSGVVVTAGVLAGCGGGKGPSPASSPAAGNDTAYVSGFCALALDMHAEGQKATKGEATPEAIRKLSPVIARAADALEKLNPPADVRPYHEALVKAARASAAKLAAYQGGHDDPFAPLEGWYLPPQIGKRLQAVAAKNPDCAKVDMHFDNPDPLGGEG